MNLAGQILAVVGSLLMLVAAIGLLRLPDLFSRMHAATKAASLGMACTLAGVALMLPGVVVAVKLAAAIMFQFVTAPVAAHVIGRAAYRARVPLWEGTVVDELQGHVDDLEDDRSP